MGKIVSFLPTLSFIFPIFGEREKVKIYIMNFGLITFKEIL